VKNGAEVKLSPFFGKRGKCTGVTGRYFRAGPVGENYLRATSENQKSQNQFLPFIYFLRYPYHSNGSADY
jgi:hypothetical protein